MRSKADETLVIVETLICPLQISHLNFSFAVCFFLQLRLKEKCDSFTARPTGLWNRTGVCKLRPASRNCAARLGLRFLNRMKPAARECFTCVVEVLDKINVTGRAFYLNKINM